MSRTKFVLITSLVFLGLFLIYLSAPAIEVDLNKPEWELQTQLNGHIVSKKELKEAFVETYSGLSEDDLYCYDSRYRLPTFEIFHTAVVESDLLGAGTYNKDFYDCEDFSRLFSSIIYAQWQFNSIGVAISETHAFVLVAVWQEREIKFYEVEPQLRGDEAFWSPSESPSPWKYEINYAEF